MKAFAGCMVAGIALTAAGHFFPLVTCYAVIIGGFIAIRRTSC